MAKKKSNKGKGSYLTYKAEDRAAKNKQRRLDKHRKNHPNDLNAPTKASGHTRKAPRVKGNYPDKIYRVEVYLGKAHGWKSVPVKEAPKVKAKP